MLRHCVELRLVSMILWLGCMATCFKADKTEVIMFTSKCNSNRVSDISVNVGVSEIKLPTCVRTIGAMLNSRVNMEQHVNTVC